MDGMIGVAKMGVANLLRLRLLLFPPYFLYALPPARWLLDDDC